jgi:DNA-directed RNA polymerase subunit M
MMFCPKCGSMLRPKIVNDKKVLACTCGYVDQGKSGTVMLTEKKQNASSVEVVDKEESAYPVVDEECPKCHNTKAFSWTQQMRAGDEPETHFFKCTKCMHTWREGK